MEKGIDKTNNNEQINRENFEEKKNEFRKFCLDFLEGVYSGKKEDDMFFNNEIRRKISQIENDPEKQGYITKEKSQLTQVFIEEIQNKSKELFFSNNYDAKKETNFHQYLNQVFFSSSPDITEDLKYDFFNYILVLSKARDTGMLDYVNQSAAGEITLSIDRVNLDGFLEKINKLSLVDKTSLVKTLGHSARWALGNGSWAFDAYVTSKNILENLLDEFNNFPLLKSIVKYQLLLIKETKALSNDNPFSDEVLNFRQKRIELFADLTQDDMKYSLQFDIPQTKSPFHKNLMMRRVAKDCVVLVDGINTSVAVMDRMNVSHESQLSESEKIFAEIFNSMKASSYGVKDVLQSIINADRFVESHFFRKMERLLYEANFYINNGDEDAQKKYTEKMHHLNTIDFSMFQEYVKSHVENRTEKKPLQYEDVIDKNPNLMSTLHTPEILWSINRDLGVNIEDMYLTEQVQFLEYLSGTKTKNWERLERVLKDENLQSENILRSFLSLDKGGQEMGQKILDIGEKLPPESANAIFAKYAELIDATQEIENFIREEFSEDIAHNPQIVDQVREKLLQRGVAVLNHFHSKIDDFNESEEPNAVQIINEALSQISADTITALSTFKFAKRQGFDLSLEDIKNSEFRKRKAEDISEAEKEEMIKIYRENYADNPVLAEQLVSKFQASFSQKENDFYLYRLNGKIHAFVKFEPIKDGKFASALNVAQEVQGFSLGEAMMEQALKTEAEHSILYAEANLAEWNTARYMELGFVAYEENTKYMVPAVNITWDDNINDQYISKKLSREDVLNKNIDDSSIIIETYKNLSDFDRSRLGKYVMTRSVFNPENNKYYIVLEETKKKEV